MRLEQVVGSEELKILLIITTSERRFDNRYMEAMVRVCGSGDSAGRGDHVKKGAQGRIWQTGEDMGVEVGLPRVRRRGRRSVVVGVIEEHGSERTMKQQEALEISRTT